MKGIPMIPIKSPITFLSSLIAGLVMQVAPLSANAYVECALTPTKFFVGDSILWVNYQEGGVGTIAQADPDFKPVFAVIMTAITTQKSVLVRYPDGASCTSQQDILGVWLSR
jgi:hypothetical protein